MGRGGQGILIVGASVPGPDELAGIDVEAADDAGWLLRRIIIDDCAADDQNLITDDRRRSWLVKARRLHSHANLEVEDAMIAEAFACLSGIGVESDHAPVVDRQEDFMGATGRR